MSNSPPAEYATLARNWLLSTPHAVLSTTSAQEGLEGWPFGSVVPFALSPSGAPFLLIAGIAQHTKNLRRDPRASLLVRDPAPNGDPQSTWRLTLLGRMNPLSSGDERIEERMARYRERVPDAPGYSEAHSFEIWEMEPERVRFIGGFGRIAWLDAASIRRDPTGSDFAGAAPRIVEHMNADHEDALRSIWASRRGVEPGQARIVEVDPAGFLVATRDPDDLGYISFGREIEASEAREVFVELTRRARS